MDKKKVKLYIILLVLLLGGVLLLPFGINFVTDAAVGAILNSTETEFEYETESESEWIEPEEETETKSEDICYDCKPDTEDETEPKTESESSDKQGKSKSSVSSSGISRYRESAAKSEEMVQQQIDFAADMEAFASTFSPEITVLDGAKDCYPDFLAGGEGKFLHAVAEYIYSHYGDMLTVDEIELIETVRNNDDECSIQACIYSGSESDIFILSYDKKLNNYGVYSSYYVD